MKAFFDREGENRWLPRHSAVGPWSPKHLHGGPVAALCVSIAEEMIPHERAVTSRLTLELIRPVPRAPLETQSRILKSGRRMNLVEVDLYAEGVALAHARIQRAIQRADQQEDEAGERADRKAGGKDALLDLSHLEGTGVELTPPTDRPEDFVRMDPANAPDGFGPAPFLVDTCEVRAPGSEGFFGNRPTVAWLRVEAELIPGVPLSPTAAVVAAADCGNALGSPETPGTKTAFPNADLSVHLARSPVDSWVRMAPETTWLEAGLGHTRCALADTRGMLGTASVTVVLTPMG